MAVDPAGVRSVLESVRLAKEKKLAIRAGFNMRFEPAYQEAMQRIKSRENQNDPGAPWSWGDFASGTAQSVYDTVTGIPGQIVDQGRQRYGEMAEAYRQSQLLEQQQAVK